MTLMVGRGGKEGLLFLPISDIIRLLMDLQTNFVSVISAPLMDHQNKGKQDRAYTLLIMSVGYIF